MRRWIVWQPAVISGWVIWQHTKLWATGGRAFLWLWQHSATVIAQPLRCTACRKLPLWRRVLTLWQQSLWSAAGEPCLPSPSRWHALLFFYRKEIDPPLDLLLPVRRSRACRKLDLWQERLLTVWVDARSEGLACNGRMRLGSAARALADCKLKYYRIPV